MALPIFRSLAARRNAKKEENAAGSGTTASDRTLTPDGTTVPPPNVNLKIATKTRRHAIYLASFFYVISCIFLLLVCLLPITQHKCKANRNDQTIIGNISNRPVLRDTYFFKLDLSNIIPASVGDISFVNSLARSIGLHDFYQIGLWNFCEGYNDEGITSCSHPTNLYWFNPVETFVSELLAGATIALPAEVTNILTLIRVASHVMFGCFLAGICMNFVSIFITPIVLRSRWWSLPIAIWTFIGALLTVVATVIATVLFVIFRNTITSQASLNIGASIGDQMFGFMWVGAAFSLFGFLIHLGLTCCCASRRDVTSGRRKGSKKAYSVGGTLQEKPNFFRKQLSKRQQASREKDETSV